MNFRIVKFPLLSLPIIHIISNQEGIATTIEILQVLPIIANSTRRGKRRSRTRLQGISARTKRYFSKALQGEYKDDGADQLHETMRR